MKPDKLHVQLAESHTRSEKIIQTQDSKLKQKTVTKTIISMKGHFKDICVIDSFCWVVFSSSHFLMVQFPPLGWND